MTDDELLPCPRCGKAAWYWRNSDHKSGEYHHVRCNTCYIAMEGHPSKEGVIAAWNTRADK